jgi:general secretion pathway protein A
MYEAFYGLRERPFNLVPDPRFLFLSKQHQEALAHLQYGLTGRPGVTVLVGEAGTGKTTLVRKALEPTEDPKRESRVVQLSNPTLTRAEFYEYLAAGYRFPPEASVSKPRFLFELEATLMAQKPGDVVALVVDEAQSLPHELLEEIRLLTNMQTVAGHALTVVLVGQPELAARLNEGRLRQLKQRVALRCELSPLDAHDTQAYIARRIEVAGGHSDSVFAADAVARVHARSGGIARTISVICDNVLVNGFADNVKPVTAALVDEVCRDFHIGADVEASAVAPPATAPKPVVARHTGIFSEPGVEPDAVASEPEAEETTDDSMFAGFSRRKRFSFFRG